MSKIEEARGRYRPDGDINVLFIAAAPPTDPSRFFYFDQVDSHDWLYLALMRLLFADARDIDVKDLRDQKPDYLARFRADGFFLIDASDAPIPQGTGKAGKRRQLQASLDSLFGKVRALAGPSTRIVLISRSVFDVCFEPLRAGNFRIVNGEMIDFPASGRQAHFQRKMQATLQASDEHLQAVIRGLEESIDYFGAGQERKRARERYVVETFLKALGQQFDAGEIEQPAGDPPDGCFRGARFEVKEIQRKGRRRHDEFKQQLARARAAQCYADLIEGFEPRSLPISEAWHRVIEEAQRAATRYRVSANPPELAELDLLVYLNLGIPLQHPPVSTGTGEVAS